MNLDREWRFWLLLAMLLPLIIALELACRIDDVVARRRKRIHRSNASLERS